MLHIELHFLPVVLAQSDLTAVTGMFCFLAPEPGVTDCFEGVRVYVFLCQEAAAVVGMEDLVSLITGLFYLLKQMNKQSQQHISC